jgi:hypothetical protein
VIVKRLDTKAIASRKQTPFAVIPNQESKHSNKTIQTGFTPAFVGSEDDFCVRLAAIGIVRELSPQFQVVVEFAIKNDPHVTATIKHRL